MALPHLKETIWICYLVWCFEKEIYVGQERNSVANWTVDRWCPVQNNTLSKDRLEFDSKHLKDTRKTLIGPSKKDSKGQILFISAVKTATGNNLKDVGKDVKFPF